MNFLNISNKITACEFLNLSETELEYILNSIDKHYSSFPISKRNGSKRFIDAPNIKLGQIQSKINDAILEVYKPKKSVHAFSKDRSIKTNALRHKKSKFVLNIDLKDFFHTITFNRVVGLFKSYPFRFSEEVSTILARLCCFKSRLPQGSPASPVISNLICRSLDRQLTEVCLHLKCQYTRYADDITISSNLKNIPSQIGFIDKEEFKLSESILDIIKRNNFILNKEKVRLQSFNNRQVVTGLIVNKKVNVNRMYVKKVRATLHAIEKFGLEKAMIKHFQLNAIKTNNEDYQLKIKYFLKRVVGKIAFIGFIRGKEDSLYRSLYARIKVIYPEARLSIISKEILQADLPIVVTEGKTDWKHIQAALQHFITNEGKFIDLKFRIKSYENELRMGDDTLLTFCRHQRQLIAVHKHPIICIFDRDKPKTVEHVTSMDDSFKVWGNNIFSMVIPVPDFRTYSEISIEHLYKDSDLLKFDMNKRRLFLTSEFNPETGLHKADSSIMLSKPKLAKNLTPKVIDHSIFIGEKSIALSKNDFSNYVLNKAEPFTRMDFQGFEPLFRSIEKILIFNH